MLKVNQKEPKSEMEDQPVKDFYKYELQVVKHHAEEYKQKTWHQHVIPEDVYYASGIITDWKQNRHDRLERLLKKNKESMKKSLLPDFGIDFLSYDKVNKSYHLGQVKCYEQARVTTKSCATFTMQVLLQRKKGYLYTSKNNLEKNFREMIEQSSGLIEHVVLPFDDRVITAELTCLDTELNFILRDYQEQAIQAVLESQERKNLLKLTTGSGKTLVAAHIIQRMKYKSIVCVAPLLCSTDQLQQRITPFIITQGHKVITVSTYGTTGVSEIDEQISKKDEPFVIFTTFKSFVEVVSKLTNLDFETTFLLVDEVHNVLNNDPLCELANKFKNSLYLSATVPEELNEVLEFQEVFSYNIRTAINDGVCVDYELYLPYLEPKEETNTILPKAHFLATGILRIGKRRCIVYVNTIAECEVFARIIEQVFEEYHGIHIETFAMNCETSKTNREAILMQFSEPNYDTIKIIVNVRILNEAIDIVACDSVFVTQIGEYTNDITIVQRLGRALREDPNNPTKTAAMFIWCEDWDQCVSGLQLLKSEDIEFHKKIHVVSGDYDKTKDYKEAVEEQQEEALRFIRVQCLTLGELWEVRRLHWNELFAILGRAPSCTSKNAAEKTAGQWQMTQRGLFKKGILLEERIDALNNMEEWEWEQSRTFQEGNSDWSEQFVILGKAPSCTSKNAAEKRAGLWQHTQRRLFKKGTLPKERIDALNNTEGWEWEGGVRTFEESKSDWSEQFVILGRSPSSHSKNAAEKRAGLWQTHQRSLFKKETLPKERIDALNNTEGWEWGGELVVRTFQESNSDWIEQFVILGRAPSSTSKNATEKTAGQWQMRQRSLFKKGTLLAERIEALNNTEGWEWSSYFPRK